jgi:hypothetical protein
MPAMTTLLLAGFTSVTVTVTTAGFILKEPAPTTPGDGHLRPFGPRQGHVRAFRLLD